MHSLLRTMIVQPVTGNGRIGNQHGQHRLVGRRRIAAMPSPVTKPIDQTPLRGCSTATIRVNLISRSLKKKSVTCLTAE